MRLFLPQGSHIPHETYSYCGSAVPHDYYSMGNEVEIQFKSSEQSSGRHVGFKLEYGISTCDRNFTGEQGRINHHDVKDCWFTITAPVGHTISVYFNEFVSFAYSGCTNSALQVSFYSYLLILLNIVINNLVNFFIRRYSTEISTTILWPPCAVIHYRIQYSALEISSASILGLTVLMCTTVTI